MKILFLMDSPEYLRFYDSAIEELAARGHAVAIAVNSGRAKKPVGLEGLQRVRRSRARARRRAAARGSLEPASARGVRATMDFVRFLHPRFAGAPALRARIKRKVLPRAYHWLDAHPAARAAALVRAAGTGADGARARDSGVRADDRLPARRGAGRAAGLAARRGRVGAGGLGEGGAAPPACAPRCAIASWDNLTNKGLLRIEPDLVMVWNEAQRREAHEYHYIPAGKIAVTGAQLFDRWFERRVTRDRAAFCQRVGLPDDGPFVLFTGSSSFISESERRSGVRAPLDRGAARQRRSGAAPTSTCWCGRTRTTSTAGRTIRWPTCRGVAVFPRARLQPGGRREPRRLLRLAVPRGGGRRHQHQRDDRGGHRRPAGAVDAGPGVRGHAGRHDPLPPPAAGERRLPAHRRDARRARGAARRSPARSRRRRRAETARFVALVHPAARRRPAGHADLRGRGRAPGGERPLRRRGATRPGRCCCGPSWRRWRRSRCSSNGARDRRHAGARPQAAGRAAQAAGAACRGGAASRWRCLANGGSGSARKCCEDPVRSGATTPTSGTSSR